MENAYCKETEKGRSVSFRHVLPHQVCSGWGASIPTGCAACETRWAVSLGEKAERFGWPFRPVHQTRCLHQAREGPSCIFGVKIVLSLSDNRLFSHVFHSNWWLPLSVECLPVRVDMQRREVQRTDLAATCSLCQLLLVGNSTSFRMNSCLPQDTDLLFWLLTEADFPPSESQNLKVL